jgi:hypothetical protein
MTRSMSFGWLTASLSGDFSRKWQVSFGEERRQFPPPCFPNELHQKTLELLRGKFGATDPTFKQFYAAWDAIKYRYAAMLEYDERFTATMKRHGPWPEAEHRFAQERDLFLFASAAYSMFGAYGYGLYAIGALLKPELFPAIRDDKEQSITFKSTKRSYSEAFSDDAILRTFEEFTNDPGRKDIYRLRNVLTHRAVSPRAFQMGRPDLPAAHLERLDDSFR